MNLTLEKIPASYRYISCLITSILYLTADSSEIINIYKIIVIIMLWTMTVLINGINIDPGSTKYVVAILETAGLTLLLIPTGGLDSPFIWYALNTTLLLGNYRTLFSWLSLSFYLISGTVISMVLFNPNHMEVTQLLLTKSDMILIFILIVTAIRFLSRINKKLSTTNSRLVLANEKAEKSIKHIMSLYQIMRIFSGHENNTDIIYKMVEYANEIMGSEISLSWSKSEPSDKDYMLAPIKSSSQVYGYLIVKEGKNKGEFNDLSQPELLEFMADLIAVVLERNQMEKVSNDLAILEEQKRIANEIHDNVSQRIFSVVCAAHALNANLQKYNHESIQDKLIMIDDSAKEINKELKDFIYRLSPEKNNKKAFYDNVFQYLNEFAALNSIKIDIELCGEAELLEYELKLALIRIIREASGNAVRHGACTKIKVTMHINSKYCNLMIEDNGRGFRVDKLMHNHEHQGLGVNNMKTLTKIFDGKFQLTSVPDKGTKIKITIPQNRIKRNDEEREGISCIS